MEKLAKCTFETSNDDETGAQYRGVITLDLANFKLPPLSYVIRDIQMLHIEKKVLTEIIRVHEAQEQSGKQVFVAFDWMDTYDAETKKTMMGHCIPELSLDGNELFSRA